MKKFIYIPIIFSFLISYVNAEDRSMNDLLKDGFKIIKEEKFDSKSSIFSGSKVFTLKKRGEMRICSVRVLRDGQLTPAGCVTP